MRRSWTKPWLNGWPLLAIIAGALSLAVILKDQIDFAFDWLAQYRGVVTFGEQCAFGVGAWAPADTFESARQRPLPMTPLAMPYRASPVKPRVPEDGYLLTRCQVDLSVLKRNAYGWMSLGPVLGPSAVYLGGRLRVVQEDGGVAEFPLSDDDKRAAVELMVVSRRIHGVNVLGLATLVPPAFGDRREGFDRVNRLLTFSEREQPLFQASFALALGLFFGVVWLLGIRFPDVAWMLAAVALIAFSNVFRLTPRSSAPPWLNPTSDVCAFGVEVALAAFVLSFLRLKRAQTWLMPGFLGLTAAFAAIKLGTLQGGLPRGAPAIAAALTGGVAFAGCAFLGSRSAARLAGARRRRIVVLSSFCAVAALLYGAQSVIYLTHGIYFSGYLNLGFGALFAAFAAADLVVFQREYETEKARAEQLTARLELGRTVQDLLLPKERAGVFHGFSYDTLHEPAEQMAGDWLYVWPRGDGELSLLMGDVAGKGPPAALAVAVIASVLEDSRTAGLTLEDAVRRLNDRLLALFRGELNTTVQAISLRSDGQALLVSCGGPGWVVGRAGTARRLVGRTSLIGFGPEPRIASWTMKLAPGDYALAYSDGCLDGSNAGQALVRALTSRGAERLATATLRDLVLTTGQGTTLPDDKCMIVVKSG